MAELEDQTVELDLRIVVETVVVEVKKLDLGATSMLAITPPECWSPAQQIMFGEILRDFVEKDDKLRTLRYLILPHGTELTVVEDAFSK